MDSSCPRNFLQVQPILISSRDDAGKPTILLRRLRRQR